jgi:ubiquinol-cytochrome c reductase cytochrome c subunit
MRRALRAAMVAIALVMAAAAVLEWAARTAPAPAADTVQASSAASGALRTAHAAAAPTGATHAAHAAAASTGATHAARTPAAAATANPVARAPRVVAAPAAPSPAAQRGHALYLDGCASCHGPDAREVPDRGPSLRGVGAAAIDFYLSTGRMPLAQPRFEPPRTTPSYDRRGRGAIVAYLTGLDASGPAIPVVHAELGDVARGRSLFADACSGCHQIVAKGGVDPEITAPPLDDATPRQIAEAIRVGPYLMPRFGVRRLDDHDVDSIARYITTYGHHPLDRGGWGIGNIGPIPEGLVAWLLAAGSLLLVARVIGKRST